jgi:hypothetical protein
MYENIISSAVLYGRETRPLTLRVEYRFKVFKNRLLRKIFGPKMVEIKGW